MKLRIKVFFIFLLVIGSQFCRSESFSEFDAKVFAEKNIDVLKSYSNQELKKYYTTKNVYYLYNSKYTESIIAGLKGKNNERIKFLNWIIEDDKYKNSEQVAIVNYHLACMLSFMNSPRISQEYAFKSMYNSIKFKYEGLLRQVYGLIGSNYYKENIFNKAAVYYKKSLLLDKDTYGVSKASMLNNIGLCTMNINHNEEAKAFFEKSITILKKINNKSEYDSNFLKIVEGNLGTVLNKLGHFEEAMVLLQKEVDYGFKNVKYLDESIPPVMELLKLYDLKNKKKELNQILSKAILLESKYGNSKTFPLLTKSLYNYYIKIGDRVKALYFSKRLIQFQTAYTDSIIKQTSELSDIIYRDKLRHLKEDKKSQDRVLELALKEKRSTQILFFTIIFLGLLIAVIVYRSNKKNRLKDSFIQDQNKQLEINKNIILENENRLQQEKITNLAINLTLKKNTEKAFLYKINELKKKKNVGVEQVIKDLQFSVTNLLSIDKKLIQENIEAEDIHQKFKIVLAKKHPNLSKTDIVFCCYFRLNLSAKEISSLHGISDGSVRVIKNRIKNKLLLLADESIRDYLIRLSD